MNKYIKFSVLILLIGVIATSCIRDEIQDCPPLRVTLTVKDKNYFNVNSVSLEDALPTDLPFRKYVPTLYYTLRDLSTGELVEDTGVFEVEGDGQTFPIQFCECLPHGKYVLTVWGGLDDEDPLEDDPMTINFHPTNNIGNDIYLTNDTIVYDPYHSDYTFEMERTKGKLLVQIENLPEGYEAVKKHVNNLYSRAKNDFSYYETTHVEATSKWNGNQTLIKSVLTPTVTDTKSKVSAAFKNESDAAAEDLIPNDVNITMRRNELTVLKYQWNDRADDFDIYILINDNWERVYSMGLEDID